MHILEKWMKQWASFSVLATVVTWVLILAILPLRLAHIPGQPTHHQPKDNLLAHTTHTDPTSTPTLTSTPTPSPTLAASAPGDWPTYMADDGHSGFNPAESIITPATAPGLRLKWTQKAGGYVASQPIEANGLVYWGSWDGFERATNRYNQTVWATYLGVTSDPDCAPSSAGVTSTATITSVENNGNEISVDFVGGGNGYFYALDARTGAIFWKTFLGSPPGYYLWSSPSVYKGSVYIGTSSLGDCPLIQGQLIQLDAATGAIQHIFNVVPNGCRGGSVWTSPTIDVAAGTVYISTGNSGTCSSSEPYAISLVELNASDLSFIHHWQVPKSERISDGDFGATPTLFTTSNGTRMVGLENKNGKYYALKRDALRKGPVWEARIATGRGSISSSAWDGNKLYVAGRTVWLDDVYCPGSLAALNPDTGAIIWQRCLMTNMGIGSIIEGIVSGAVAAAPGVIVYGQGSYVFVFSAASGKILFSYHDTDTDSYFHGWASISNGILYIGSTDGKLLAFAPQ